MKMDKEKLKKLEINLDIRSEMNSEFKVFQDHLAEVFISTENEQSLADNESEISQYSLKPVVFVPVEEIEVINKES